jgi:hypothetical protein
VADDVVVRATLEDELSQPIRGTRQEIERTTDAVERLDRAGRRRPLDSLTRGKDALSRAARGAHSSVGRLSDMVGSQLARSARAGAIGLTALTAAAAGFGVNTAARMETSRVALEALTGSTAEAVSLFDYLKELDPLAPFDIGQLQQATLFLGNSGLRGEELRRTIQGVVDVGSLMPDRFEDTARAISQISGSGTLLTQDLNQLVQAGVDVSAAMQQAFGIDFATFRREQEGGGGQFSSDLFLQALFGLRAGTAEKVATDTLTGLLSGVRSRVMLQLTDTASPLVDQLKESLPTIEAAIGGLLANVAPHLLRLGTTLLDLAVKALPAIEPVLAALAQGASTLLNAMAPALVLLEPVLDDLALAMGELVAELVPVMPDLVRAFVRLVAILPDFVRLLADLAPYVDDVAVLAIAFLDLADQTVGLENLLLVLLGYRALSGVISAVWGFANALGAVAVNGSAASTVGGAAGAARIGTMAAGGLIAGGGAAQAHGILGGNRSGWSDEMEIIGGGAALGAGIGSIIPGAGTLVGGALGAAVGGIGVLGRNFIIDRAQQRSSVPASASSAPVTVHSSTTVAPNGVVINGTSLSELELQHAVTGGIQAYEAERARRSAGD